MKYTLSHNIKQTPFFPLILSLISGILIYEYLGSLNGIIILSVLLLIGSTFIIHMLLNRSKYAYQYRWLFGFAVLIAFSAWGYTTSWLFDKNHQFESYSEVVIYEVEVKSALVEKPKSYMCEVKLIQAFDSISNPLRAIGNALIYLQKDSIKPDLIIGDKLLINTQFQTPEGVKNPEGFDYARYLKRQGIMATAYISNDNWIKSTNKPRISIQRISDLSRTHLLNIYKRFGLEDDEFAVLAALTLGYKDDLQEDIRKVYSASGAAHILAVSGLHVSTVFGAVFLIFSFLGKGRRMRIFRTALSIILIWIYALITGMSPAVIRASLMLSFVAIGTSFRQRHQIYNTVLMSAFFMLLVNPNLIFNISFQLSYAAVLSIISIQKLLYPVFTPSNKVLKWLWGLITVSIAAQIGTAPITIFYFNQFPNYFILTNLVAIPLASLIIYFSIAFFAVFSIAYLNEFIALVLKKLVYFLNYLLKWIVSLPGSMSSVYITNSQLWLLVAALLLFLYFFYFKNKKTIIMALTALFLFASISTYLNYQSNFRSQIVVFSDSRTPIINFIYKKHNYIYTNDIDAAIRSCSSYWKLLKLDNPADLEQQDFFENGFLHFSGKNIFILTDNSYNNKVSTNRLDLDYLIVTNNAKPKFDQILELFNPRKVIIDKSISNWYTNHIKEICILNNTDFYSVAEMGAYIEEIHLENKE